MTVISGKAVPESSILRTGGMAYIITKHAQKRYRERFGWKSRKSILKEAIVGKRGRTYIWMDDKNYSYVRWLVTVYRDEEYYRQTRAGNAFVQVEKI